MEKPILLIAIAHLSFRLWRSNVPCLKLFQVLLFPSKTSMGDGISDGQNS